MTDLLGGGAAAVVKAPEAPAVTDADVLERAADLLGEFDWCQGRLGSKDAGEMCAAGALHTAAADVTGTPNLADGVLAALASAGVRFENNGNWDLAVWNDVPGRTKAEVVARLRLAAGRAREGATEHAMAPTRRAES